MKITPHAPPLRAPLRPERTRLASLFAFLCASVLASACSGAVDDEPSAPPADTNQSEISVSTTKVNAALATLRAQTTTGPYAKYYADGVRVEACWRNPAGNKLTNLKKAFYCSMPLEFRLCNTVKLLTIDESDVDGRYQGFLDCQKTVDAMLGGTGEFVYDDAVNDTYKRLYLQGRSLGAARDEAIVSAHKPRYGNKSFAQLLAKVVAGLAAEGRDVASAEFDAMVTAAKDTGKPIP